MDLYSIIKKKLQSNLINPDIYINDISHLHKKRADSPSHLEIIVISKTFLSLNRIKRHQLIYDLLNFPNVTESCKLHAIALQTYTPEEYHYQKTNNKLLITPNCVSASIKNKS